MLERNKATLCKDCIFFKTSFSQSSFGFLTKLRGRCRDFPYITYHNRCKASTIINITHQCGTFVIIDLLLLNLINQSPQFTVGFTLGVVPSLGLDKSVMTRKYPYSIVQSIFATLKIFCPLLIHPSLTPQSLVTTDLFTVAMVLPFQECHRVGMVQYVSISKICSHFKSPFSLRNIHLEISPRLFMA